MIIGWTVLFYSLCALYMGIDLNDYYQINNSIFGLSTRTNKGKTGYLVWRFKPNSIDYFPNYLMYLVMCFLAFTAYEHPGIKIFAADWITSMFATCIILNPVAIEFAYTWCLLSIVANIMIRRIFLASISLS